MSCPCDPSGKDNTPCPDPKSKLPACCSAAEHELAVSMAKAGGRLVSPDKPAKPAPGQNKKPLDLGEQVQTVANAAARWPFPGTKSDKLKAAQHRANDELHRTAKHLRPEIAQLGKPFGADVRDQLIVYAALAPFLGLIESAVREYSTSSRDLDEQLHARRALEVIVKAQQVQP